MNPRTVRIGVVVVTVFWVALVLWAVGPVMRESDQAALLQGALALAHEPGNWQGNASYNYDKQYLSYWVVAAWLRLRGEAGAESTLEGVVRDGNLVAVGLCALTLLVLVGTQRKWSWGSALVLVCILFAPVVAFTGVLLSPNLLSAAFLFALLALLRRSSREAENGKSPSIFSLALVAIFSWAATAARQDIVLVMPLLALLVAREERLQKVWTDRTVWAIAGGCVVAIAAGMLISAKHTGLPAPFFVLKTFVPYLAGGLGALLLPLALFSWQAARGSRGYGLALAGAALLPLLFYSFFLFTPRHLLVVALGLCATVFLRRGKLIWSSLGASMLGAGLLVVALALTALPWVMGARMSGWKSGRAVAASSTLYPTTDGFWPLGAYGWFYGRLAHAADRPLDHNQQVWSAWAQVDPAVLPEGRGAVVSAGLVSYGRLYLEWAGVTEEEDLEQADFMLFDDRTLSKMKQHYAPGDNRGRVLELLARGSVRQVGSAEGRRIFLWRRDGPPAGRESTVSVILALAEHFGGNDFRVARGKDAFWREEALAGHRAAVVVRSAESESPFKSQLFSSEKVVRISSSYDEEPWLIFPLSTGELQTLEQLRGVDFDEDWVATGSLPAFMDVRKYSD